MKLTKKTTALLLALCLALTAAASTAAVLEPEETDVERLAGRTLSATVGEYDEAANTLTLTLYEADRFDRDDVKRLAPGDVLLAGGTVHTVSTVGSLDGDVLVTCTDGEEIVFSRAKNDDDEMTARSTVDDRLYMHAFAVVRLPVSAGILLEDASSPEGAAAVTKGLQEILGVRARKEADGIGFHYYNTTVSLDRNLEIVRIHLSYDPAQ